VLQTTKQLQPNCKGAQQQLQLQEGIRQACSVRKNPGCIRCRRTCLYLPVWRQLQQRHSDRHQPTHSILARFVHKPEAVQQQASR
jgi:hypothetical protein